MQLEIGTVLEGKVTRVMAYGVFVALGGDVGGSGMVHISELSTQFIKDINAVVKPGDTLRVKVISIDERGRISLSVRQAMTEEEIAAEKAAAEAQRIAEKEARDAARRQRIASTPTGVTMDAPAEFVPYVRRERETSAGGNGSADSFEDMMSRFKNICDDKMSDLKKYTEGRKSSKRRR